MSSGTVLMGGNIWRGDSGCGHLLLFVASEDDCLGVRHGTCLVVIVFCGVGMLLRVYMHLRRD